LIVAVSTRLNRPPCRIVGSELKLIAAGHVRYPDAMILCSPRQPGRTSVSDPIVVFEIMSPSSVATDMIHKNAEYRATPSVQRYVILEQSSVAAMMFTRKGEDWVSEIVEGSDAVLRLPEIGIEFPLGELYRDIDFPPGGAMGTEA
jgi:Uma2 family endonuclease